MAVVYSALKGNAGTVKFWLYQIAVGRIPIVPAPMNTVYINVSGFAESMEDSELNSTFEDGNGDLNKVHYGRRQVISFNLINGSNVPIPAGATKSNRRAIQEIVQMINLIDNNPWDYQLKIQYRDDATISTINSAIYTGGIELSELIADANLAQSIPLEFKDKVLSDPDFGETLVDVPVSIMEALNESGGRQIIVAEDSSVLRLQSNQFNVTP